jgi:hypothetical protein
LERPLPWSASGWRSCAGPFFFRFQEKTYRTEGRARRVCRNLKAASLLALDDDQATQQAQFDLAKMTIRRHKFGGQGVNRTLDTRIFSPLLYRLSYLPTVLGRIRDEANPNSYP